MIGVIGRKDILKALVYGLDKTKLMNKCDHEQ